MADFNALRVRTHAARYGRDVEGELERWRERAAVREYLAGMPRQDAELVAVGDVQLHLAMHYDVRPRAADDARAPNE